MTPDPSIVIPEELQILSITDKWQEIRKADYTEALRTPIPTMIRHIEYHDIKEKMKAAQENGQPQQ